MRATLKASILMVLAGCAGTPSSGPAPVSTGYCIPCDMPCTPDSSCKGAAAAAARVAVTAEKLELKDKIFFDTGEATIKPVSHSLLDEVAGALKSHEEAKQVQIEGHTDNTGDAELNTRLSQDRADAVRTYLVGKGIAEGRLSAKGYGPERPVATNETEEGREANRRVEFKVVK